MRIDDVSPRDTSTTIRLERTVQSTSGKALCCAISFDARRAYLGGHSGVWRSDDGGATWWHPEWPQPPAGTTAVPGALLAPNVYDLHVDPRDANVVLAATGNDARVPSQAGIYRSTDGAQSWRRVHHTPNDDSVGSLSVPRDDFSLVFAACGTVVARSTDGGVTWSNLTIPPILPFFPPEPVFHVSAGLRQGGRRRVYALGSRLWYSRDAGQTWQADPQPLSQGFPTDGGVDLKSFGASAHVLAVHPTNPAVVFVILVDGRIFRGEYPAITSGAPGVWTQLASTPIIGPIDSGADQIVPFVTASGDFLLFASDRRTMHVAFGEPADVSEWTRVEDGHCHGDPHGLAITPDFHRQRPGGPVPTVMGRILLVNDGGAVFSDDGAKTWTNGRDLHSLGIVNASVNAFPDRPPAICMGMGDNSGFSSPDGGATWETQDYVGGDNDCCFTDPRQPSRLIVFAPRHLDAQTRSGHLFYYKGSSGHAPDASLGTGDRVVVPGPVPFPVSPTEKHPGWSSVSNFYNFGYRPLVLTPAGESPPAELDFVTIRYTLTTANVMRSTAPSRITGRDDWLTTATADGPNVKVFRVGPDLPVPRMSVVQAAGGHANPTFYVGDPDGGRRIWTLRPGAVQWEPVVPAPPVRGRPVPAEAQRFFVHPYQPRTLYVLSSTHVFRTDDAGGTWVVDESLERALTEDGAFPFLIPYDANPEEALFRDMAVDPDRPGTRFALGPAGVFFTLNGVNWSPMLRSSAIATRPNNLVYDFVSCQRALYVTTSSRGLLRITPIPSDWEYPIDSLQGAEGRVTLLRVHEMGTKYGPPFDQIDADVIVWLDTEPDKAFGFTLRTGADVGVARGMLDLLRDAFNRDRRVRLDFVRTGCRTGRIVRVIDLL